MSGWARATLIANIVLGLLLIFALWFRDTSGPALGDWSYSDLVTVLLAIVTVVLGALALLLALAAIWGYQQMAKSAAEQATAAAQQAGRDYLTSDAFVARVRAIAQEHLKNDIEAKRETLELVTPEADATPATPDTEWRDEENGNQ